MIPLRSLSPAINEVIEVACAYENALQSKRSLYVTANRAFDKGDTKARAHLEENKILEDGLSRILQAGYQPCFSEYIYAVAIASRRMKRKPDELLYLKRLIVRNYESDDQIKVMIAFCDIADGLDDNGANYLNYIIEELTEFLFAKKACRDDPESLQEYFQAELEIIEEGITNGIQGFMFGYGSEMFNQTVDLLHLATESPLRLKRKQRTVSPDYDAYTRVRRGGF